MQFWTTTGTAPSTFRQGMGEIIEDLTPKKKTSRAVMFAAIAAMTGAVFAIAFGRSGITHFNLSTSSDAIKLPILAIPTKGTGVVVTVVLGLISIFERYWFRWRADF